MPTRPRTDLLFVGVQFVLLLALAFDPLRVGFKLPVVERYIAWSICVATVVAGVAAVLQLGTNLTPWPSPKDSSQLVTSGLYAWSRHPIYACLAWFGLGLALATGSWWRIGVTACLWVLFWRKATYEERMLQERYPSYESYAQQVPRFGLF